MQPPCLLVQLVLLLFVLGLSVREILSLQVSRWGNFYGPYCELSAVEDQ